MSIIQRYPLLDSLRAKRTELADNAERIAAGISLAEGAIADLEAERTDLQRKGQSARSQAAAAQMQTFLSGGDDVSEVSRDQRRIVALATVEGKIETASDGLRELRAMHSNAIRELEAVEASRHAEADKIITAAIEAQAAVVEKLRADYVRAGAVLRELVPDDMYSPVSAGQFASADVLRILEELPKPNDLNISSEHLRRGHARPRDRFTEMRTELLVEDSVAEARQSAAA